MPEPPLQETVYDDYAPQTRTNGMAIASLVCGIVGCLFVTAILAIVFGIIGLRQSRGRFGNGRGMAIAGLVLGLIWLPLMIAGGSGLYVLGKGLFDQFTAMKGTAEKFVGDVSVGNIDTALQNATPNVDRAKLEALHKSMKPWGNFVTITIPGFQFRATNNQLRWMLSGDAIFSEATKGVTIWLVPDKDDTYKVDGIDLR